MDRWKRGHNVGGRGKSFNCFLSSFVPGILMRTKVRISFFSATEIELSTYLAWGGYVTRQTPLWHGTRLYGVGPKWPKKKSPTD